MFEDRQQFDMGKPHALHMLGQSRRNLAVGEQAIVLTAHPRTEMHFVHEHRLTQRVGVGALRQPGTVLPIIRAARLHDRCVSRSLLHLERIRIGLDAQRATGRPDLELVHRLGANARHEQFEHATGSQPPHLMCASVPAVEGADYRDARGVRGPDSE